MSKVVRRVDTNRGEVRVTATYIRNGDILDGRWVNCVEVLEGRVLITQAAVAGDSGPTRRWFFTYEKVTVERWQGQ